ncbi:MiaB/RimO family radical SAM methylthiotransferase [Aquipuribacter hungaricus]|uniref:MiaB/RimO family radical SAM methylthiotransferase n=1 Tax=Aquipuribacter hungaricus TaxID=545624 RepID=UPI00360DFA29
MPAATSSRRVAITSLGCARNDVDSEELAGRLQAEGWTLVDDPSDADVAVVNTCGFVEQAKQDSVDTLLEAAQLKDGGHDGTSRTRAVVAVGCLAERYGTELAGSLPEADAVLGFDSYADMSSHLQAVLAGERPASHVPRDRRSLLPLSPVDRQAARAGTAVPGTGVLAAPDAGVLAGRGTAGAPSPVDEADGPSLAAVAPASGPPVVRARLGSAPWASLKIASGCDRRCTFCAIPAFRGSFVSRRPTEVLDEARWLAERGVREVFLVSENTTSYGKDLGDLDLLQSVLPEVAAVDGIERVRVSYLQPAELRPGLLEAIATTPGVVPYFDLSFQHASATLLRRMRRFGGSADFLDLLGRVRALAPAAGVRSNVIVGFPGETEADVEELVGFLSQARLDVVGVFGYSDEDGTEAETYGGKHDAEEVAARVEHVSAVVDELVAQRAEDRVGEAVDVLVEEVLTGDAAAEVLDLLPGRTSGEVVVVSGRAAHQGPEVDGTTAVLVPRSADVPDVGVGTFVRAVVVASDGADLVAAPGPVGGDA